jgi:hypothetical protein
MFIFAGHLEVFHTIGEKDRNVDAVRVRSSLWSELASGLGRGKR